VHGLPNWGDLHLVGPLLTQFSRLFAGGRLGAIWRRRPAAGRGRRGGRRRRRGR
jgi:hypothetical protein